MRKTLYVILACILMLSCTSCNRTSVEEEVLPQTDESKQEETTEKQAGMEKQFYRLKNVAEKIKCLGRSSLFYGGIACDLSASGIAFNAYVSGDITLGVNCSFSDKAADRASKKTYFTVFVDGERQDTRYSAPQGKSNVTIKLPEEAAMHEIRIIKQGESQFSLCVMESLEFCGRLESAVANREFCIEFIGDSITCGYANLCKNGETHAVPEAEDVTAAYSFLAAELLNADCTIVSRSGIGLDKGLNDPFNMRTFYGQHSYHRSAAETDFSKIRTPNVVVINLGTNDAIKNVTTKDEYKAAAKSLIEYVRASYKTDMPIVWVTNMMGNCHEDWTLEALAELGGETAGLYSLKAEKNQDAGAGHPDLEAHEATAQLLAGFIKEKKLLNK